MQIILNYLVVLLSLIGLDLLWFSCYGASYFRSKIGPLMLTDVNLACAFFVYIIMTIGFVTFVIKPYLNESTLSSILHGALFGFILYGTYEGTNGAILKEWSVGVMVLDTAWGTLVGAILGGLGHHLKF
ncbi:MAG: DUF2177 family protein [Pseudomonadota bacterium]